MRNSKNEKHNFYDSDNIREVGYQDENEFYPVKYGRTSLKNNISQSDNIVNNNSMYQQGNNMPSGSSVSREIVSNDLTGIKGNAGIVYNKVQAQLLSQFPIEALQNASDLASQRDYCFQRYWYQ